MTKKICIICTLVLIATIIFSIFVYYYNYCCWTSVFNSSFGALNALFSGLAFGVVIVTLYWQQQDSYNKSFESNLYKQIEFFITLTENLSYKNSDGADCYEGKGRDIFEWFYTKKKYFVNGRDDLLGLKEKLRNNSRFFLNDSATNIFDSYFNYLFNIYSYIDKSKLEPTEQQGYANQLTALLTQYELLLIYYYIESLKDCIDQKKYGKLSELCIKYHIFKNLNKADLANPNHENLINTKAFI